MSDETPKKKRKNSRAKGAGFERKIATQLRDWLGEGWTVARNQTDRQKGQVGDCGGEFTIEHEGGQVFPFAIECKAVEAFHESHLFDPEADTGPVHGFWQEAIDQAASVGRRPLLICKRNLGPVLVIARECDLLPLLGLGSAPRMYANIQGEVLLVVPLACLLLSTPHALQLVGKPVAKAAPPVPLPRARSAR